MIAASHAFRFKKGSALLIVLAAILLFSALALAFFAAVTTERNSSKSYADSFGVNNLANSALQLAMAQISDGTAGGKIGAGGKVDANQPLAWASQPGMIRTYDDSGKPYRYFKLYSSSEMVIDNPASFTVGADLPPANWKDIPSLWTDLNAPVADRGGILNYPIVSPAALTNGVQGFAINNPPGYTSGPASATNNPAPMPVKWLYQLRDGTLVAANGSGGTVTVAGASKSNPIVGRIAFWTDDETSKVNINTAAEGVYWDTPRFKSVATPSATTVFPDYGYAAFPPALFEFQRYPGHPAQVALSTIFPGVTSANAAKITPRLVFGGSEGGTKWAGMSAAIDLSLAPRKALYASTDEFEFSGAVGTPRTVNTIPGPATKEEIEAAKFFITASSRAPEVNLFNLPRIACWPIDKSLASSPASPRGTAYDRLIAFCSTLRADLGASSYRYYFQRDNSQSPTADYIGIPRNQNLYSYLQRLTSAPVPGFGGNFLTKYAADRDQILTEIFDYIRCTNLSDPTLGGLPVAGSSWAKSVNQFANYQNVQYSSDANSIYCGQVMPIRIGATMGFGRYHTIKDVSMVFACVADGKAGTPVAPVTLPTADPDKTAETVIRSSNDTTAQPALIGTPLLPTEKRMQVGLFLNYFLPSPGQLKCGPDQLVRISGLETIRIAGATNIDGGGDIFPAALPPTPSGWVGKLTASGFSGYNPTPAVPSIRLSVLQHRSPLYWRNNGSIPPSTPQNKIIYPFISRAFTLPANAPLTLLNPVTLKIEIFQAKGAFDPADAALASVYKMPGAPDYTNITANPGENLIQTITVTFPSGTFPQPSLVTLANGNLNGMPTITTPATFWGFDKRIALCADPSIQASSIIAAYNYTATSVYDTVRTVSVKTGDVRAVAATAEVPAGMFDVSTSYSNVSVRSFHYFNDNTPLNGSPLYPNIGLAGKLIPGISGASGNTGDYPVGTEVNYSKFGDFDGPQTRTDNFNLWTGSFINKPDEGDSQDIGTGGSSAIPYYGFNQSTVKNVSLYTPNRIMPSPGMFGSLPTGVQRQIASNGGTGSWQTLLFRPQATHPNYSATIPDHLMMDLFWMPVVEPYAISEPFSTAGKVNLNYQILPFSYITRSTALVSALKAEKLIARPLNTKDVPVGTSVRLDLNTSDTGGTLQQIKEKFAAGDIFKSASEICDLDLVPTVDPNGAVQTWSSSWGQNFWQANASTGDNLRERPYTNLYARLTTKSNTFTVHVRAQLLQKVIDTAANQWVEGRDKIVAEARGATLTERYVDVEDAALPDFATTPLASLADYYKMRIINTKSFAP